QAVVRVQGRLYLQSNSTNLAVVQTHSGWRVRTGRRDVHGAETRHRRRAEQARAAEHRAMAPAHKFMLPEKGHRPRKRRLDEVRDGHYREQKGMRRGG